jgi:hypothetical protein
MGWIDFLFPEKARLQEQVQKMQQQIDRQSGLIARMHATLIHLRAENAVLSVLGEKDRTFLEKKVEHFKEAAAAMLRNSEHNTACREHLEVIRRAANDISQSNYRLVIGAPDVKDAIFALEMQAEIPCIGQMLLAAHILSMYEVMSPLS